MVDIGVSHRRMAKRYGQNPRHPVTRTKKSKQGIKGTYSRKIYGGVQQGRVDRKNTTRAVERVSAEIEKKIFFSTSVGEKLFLLFLFSFFLTPIPPVDLTCQYNPILSSVDL